MRHGMLLVGLLIASACGQRADFGPAPPPHAPAPAPFPAEPGHVIPPPPAAGGEPMKPIAPSAMASDLETIGLDPGHLPPLDKLAPDKLRKVMRTFTRSLGFRCTDCHLDDYAAPTPRKTITRHMWDELTRPLAFQDGALLYCDSCHQGRPKLLDRGNAKAIDAFMKDSFVAKLKRADDAEHGCATCHGEPFDQAILKKWATP